MFAQHASRPGKLAECNDHMECEQESQMGSYIAQGVLGVFQKLIASKAHDHEGFFILNSLLEYLPMELYQQYLPNVRSRL